MSTKIATATTKDNGTQVTIWKETAYTGRTVFIVDFVHMVKRAADRRSMTWATKFTEAEARQAANECFAKWNGTQLMLAA